MQPESMLRSGVAPVELPASRGELLLFLSEVSGGGAQRRLLTLARAFAERGRSVRVIAVRSRGDALEELPPEVQLDVLDPSWAGWSWVRARKGLWVQASAVLLAGRLRRTRPAAVLSASHPANVTALWARSLARVGTRIAISVNAPLSYSTAGSDAPRRVVRRWQARRFYPSADVLIANTHGIAVDVAAVTGLPRERIRVIHNPIASREIEQRARMHLDHPWFQPHSPPVVLSAGKLKRQKGFAGLLEAFALVRRHRPVRLMILGEGELRATLEARARELGIAGDVSLPGFCPNPFPYMARAAVFVSASLWEGFSNVIAEALACGCPVVGTHCPGGGPAEILEGGVYGELVPLRDAHAMAAAIGRVLEARPGAARLRARAAEFSVARAAECYLDALAGAGAGVGP